jgi:hypothetical protein
MQTECVRCHKVMDTVQGYKFSPTEYLCMSCYDEFKAERAAKSKKDHKNPLLDRYGTEGMSPAAQPGRPHPVDAQPPEPRPSTVPPAQTTAPPAAQEPAAPQAPRQPASPPAPQPAPQQSMFAPKSAAPTAPPVGALKSPGPKKPPTSDVCDVCQKPIPDFKVPLKGGKKVCMGCNDLLREVAKSLVLNVQCPQCGHEFQVADE